MEQTPFSPRDLLLAHKWSSLLFTTYSLSLSFLEAVALSAVARSYRSFTVLADIAGYRSSLSDAGAIGVGRNYDVVSIGVRNGVFHPKIALVADEEGTIRATVGSGNLTFGGWGYNTEVLDVLVPGADSNCFADLAAFLEALAVSAAPGGRLETERRLDLGQFADLCRMASRTPGADNSRLLHTMMEPLDAQIGQMADDLGGATAMTVVSPFFSTHLGVMQLARALSCEQVSVSVPPVAPSIFDFDSCRAAGFSVSPVTCDLFSDTRSLHAKLFDIECRRGRIVISGSANATTAALSGRNVEAVVARVADGGTKLGWRPSGTHSGHATGERPPEEEKAGPCIVAYFDGRGINGRIFGLSKPEGEWLASLSSGTRRETAGSVTADASGRFRFLAPDGMDPIALASSAQVIFERGGSELRGWLVLQDLLHAIRERGPVARSFGRMLSGTATAADANAILEYLAKAPGTLLDAADRQGGGRKDRTIAVRPPGAPLTPDALRPVDAFDMRSTWTGGGVSRAFDTLLDALVRHFASSLPDANDLAGDDEDDSDELAGPAKRGSAPAKRGQRVPLKLARKAFEAMFAALEKQPAGPKRVPGLYALFDMMVQIAPRCDDGDELTASCSVRWLAAAQGCRVEGEGFNALDRCVAVILTKQVMDNPVRAVRSHAALQRWLGGELSEAAIMALEPDAEQLDARRLAPGAVQEGWSAAWRAIVSTVTPWATANALVLALRNGGVLDLPTGITKEESAILQAVAEGRSKPDRVATIEVTKKGKAACPRCHIVLPSVRRAQLRSVRVATCGNFRCNRVIIDISL